MKRNLAVKAAAESLDYACWDILIHAAAINEIDPPSIRTMGQALSNQSRISGISRLLEIGALKTKYRQMTPELISELKDQSAERLLKYQLTHFGVVLINYIVSKMGINMSPGLREKIEKLVEDTADTTKTK